MDFYEELGVRRTASAEEIRRSYRALARLLHPDQYPDENVRRLAELQMRRLNDMAEALTDPERRRAYDLSLVVRPAAPAEPVVGREAGGGRGALIVCGVAAALALGAAVMLTRPASEPERVAAPVKVGEAPRPAARPQPAEARGEREREPARVAALAAELKETRRALAEARAENARLMERPARRAAVPRPTLPPVVASAPAAAARPVETALERRHGDAEPEPKKAPAGLAGNWFYVRGVAQPASQAAYAPEYIELRITEAGGMLEGRYRARYKVTDRAISPQVSFRFEGRGSGTTARMQWAGAGGAAGEVALQLTGENTMTVNWTARRLSQELGLAAGTAVLVRQQN